MSWDAILRPKPVYDPKQDVAAMDVQVTDWILHGGESPLPMWPDMEETDA